MDETEREAALARLEPLVGEWTIEAFGMQGSTTFEWALDRRFLVERSAVPHPDAPDGLCVIGIDPRGEAEYAQHYFDSRGVVRVYAMTFEDGVWGLLRNRPDFSPLNFWQRFSGTFEDGGSRIRGAWESSEDEGATWELDFPLTYTRTR
jgi:hypothetical protein